MTLTTNIVKVDGYLDVGRSKNRFLARAKTGRIWCTYIFQISGVSQVCVAYSDDKGVTWTQEQVSSASQTQYDSVIAIDSQDNLHVLWDGRGYVGTGFWRQVQYRKRNSDGTWDAQVAITASTYAAHQAEPSIAIDSLDNVHITWKGRGILAPLDDYKVFYQRWTPSGWDIVEAVASIATGGLQWYPSITIDLSDNVHVVWTGPGWGINTTFDNIQYRKKTAGGWQAQVSITDVAYDQYVQSFTVGLDGLIHVAWAGYGYGTNIANRNIQYVSCVAGIWGTRVPLTDVAYEQGPPAVAVDASGNITLAWIGAGWGANPFQDSLQIIRKIGGIWQAQVDAINRGADQIMPSLLNSLFPFISGKRTNLPKSGFMLLFNGADGIYGIEFYSSASFKGLLGNIHVDQLIYQHAERMERFR
jgi:hypothetical protein